MPTLPDSHRATTLPPARLPDTERLSARQRGYTWRWQKYRASFLNKNPVCAECLKHDQGTPATIVDHVVPHRGDQQLFWDPTNHQALCKQCHDRKTATEDGGFGRLQKP